ncbi:tyrosine-protein phosphatase [Paenibacillus sp. D2_2]|uniref:tyrosine-protein phosphatase n=1 Tax=Paenibacillus sp. D2_2 TaxID=3073092 RepID=UPI002814F81A|nr:tyrosine-protein phosphatase [Paenibacillus sp. D2_2]WMT43413.1 tyrosine-protein phosphatase [Paenibacillus sp. D2_2]
MKVSTRICTLTMLALVITSGAVLQEVQAKSSPNKATVQKSIHTSTTQTQGKFTQASVEYTKDRKYIIRWKTDRDLGAAKVYWSTSPDDILKNGKVLAHTYTQFNGYVTSDPAPGQRVYFAVKGGNGAVITVAEREVRLEGVINFRDLGGYVTSDGRHVKWGKLFRSGELEGLTATGKKQAEQLGLHTIVDYRTNSEVEAKPDPDISKARYVRLPAVKEQEGSNGTDLNKLIASGDYSSLGKPGEMLVQANKDLVDAPDAYVKLLEIMNDPANIGLVQHCTAGKDRTGLGSAIILLTLGVSKETVMQDYLLSNVYRAEANQRTVDAMRKVIQDKDALESFKALLDVRKEYLQAAFDMMEKNYGSIDAFIEKGLGVSPQERAKLQSMYLE